jgi:hypothetical protein
MDHSDEKKAVLNALRSERDRWEALLARYDEKELTERKLPGGWSLKDVIAHLTGWQRRTVRRLEAGLEDGDPGPPEWPEAIDEGTEEGTDQVNAWLYARTRDLPLEAVLAEWRQVLGRVIELGEAIPEEKLFDPQRYAWIEGYPLIAVIEGSYNHYHEEHWEPLLEALGLSPEDF